MLRIKRGYYLFQTRSWIVLFVVCLACYTHAQLPGGSLPGGPGMPTGNSTGGAIPGGGGGMGGLMQMGPHAPNAIHHVGIAYNLLKGNPDGEYWSTGISEQYLLTLLRPMVFSRKFGTVSLY